MKFAYQAKNNEGQIKTGFVVASSQNKAEQMLSENGFVIISLRQKREDFFQRHNIFAGTVSYKELVLFSRQLATLIGARVPIIQSLRILQAQASTKALQVILKDLVVSVENGESFSLALSKHPEIFSNIYVSLVKSGEASGAVGRSLNFLAEQLEKDYELRAKIKSAMTYPVFVLAALGGVGFLMFKFVLPKLTEILKEQGGELPMISRWIVSSTDFFQVYWWVVILLVGGLIFGLRSAIKTKSGRYYFDELKIRVPYFKKIFIQIYLARFARNFATMVGGGIPILQSLKIVSEILNNEIYKDILLDTHDMVTNGKSVSDALVKYPKEFPAIVVQMVKVGEQTASLDEILLKLADFYEKEVDNRISTLSTLLEPVIMIILGLGVGILVAGILLPIYNLAGAA